MQLNLLRKSSISDLTSHLSGVSPVPQNRTHAHAHTLRYLLRCQRPPQNNILLKLCPENGFRDPVLQVQPALIPGLPDEVVAVKGVADESAVAEVNLLGCYDPLHVRNLGTENLLPRTINVISHLVKTPPLRYYRVNLVRPTLQVKLENICQILFLCRF